MRMGENVSYWRGWVRIWKIGEVGRGLVNLSEVGKSLLSFGEVV